MNQRRLRPLQLARFLVHASVWFLPLECRGRYRDEWLAELEAMERERISPLLPALRILLGAPAVGCALHQRHGTVATRRLVATRLAVGLPLAAALGVAAQWPMLSTDPSPAGINLAVGLSFLATGVVMSVEPRQGRVAAVLATAGVLWPLPWARIWEVGPLPLLAVLVGPLPGLLVAWALLHYPTRWTNLRRERILIGLLAATQSLVLPVVVTAEPAWHGLPAETFWLSAWPNRTLFDIATIVYNSGYSVLAFAVAVAFPLRIRRLPGPDRHIMMPVAMAVGVAALATAVSVLLTESQSMFLVLHRLCFLGIPLAFLLAVLRRILTRNAICLLADRLCSTTDADMVQSALRVALTDPTLEILYWMSATRGYVDTAGTPRQPPGAGDPLLVGDVRADGGEPLALVVANPSLARHPQMARPATRALTLSLANTRLHAEIRAQIARVHHSQQRLASVVTAERQRLEDDIAGGAGKQLQALGEHLGTVLGDTGAGDLEDPATQALRTVQDQLPAVQDELRHLARGLAPDVITDGEGRGAE